MNFNVILKDLRTEKKVSQAYVADELGITKQSYSLYELGKRNPDNEMLYRLSEFFDVSLDYLLGRTNIRNVSKQPVKIPVLGTVRAGIPIEAIEEIIDYEEITSEMASTGDFFALQIKGDSMEPKFSEGDVVIVRKQSTADTGDVVVALINGDEATIKKLKRTTDGIILVATNPNYEPMFFNIKEISEKPVNVIGKVVELRAKF